MVKNIKNSNFLCLIIDCLLLGRGRAEISRLIFAAAGVEFTDERIKNWPTGKEGD